MNTEKVKLEIINWIKQFNLALFKEKIPFKIGYSSSMWLILIPEIFVLQNLS